MSTNQLTFNKVTKYFGKQMLFDSLSYNFEPNQIHLIVGANGAGKSTLLNMISRDTGLDAGEVILKGNIFYLQAIPSFFKFEKVKDFISFVAHSYNSSGEYLNLLYLISSILNKKLNTLSTGELQKTILISALASEADTILLDEPTNGIDDNFKNKLPVIFEKILINSSQILITTHLIEDFYKIKNKKLYVNNFSLNKENFDSNVEIKLTVGKILEDKLRIIIESEGARIKSIKKNDTDIDVVIHLNEDQGEAKKIIKCCLDNNIEIIKFSKSL
jgi:ABC-type multidrug transport system ATPase subunit